MRASMRSPLRFALFTAATTLLAAGTAAAQDGGVGSSTFGADDFFIGVQHTPGANLSDFDVLRFFNKARCDCSEPVYVYVALTNSGFAKRTTVDKTGNIEFWVGTDCGNTSLREFRCKLLQGLTMQAFINDGRVSIPTTARVLSTYTGGGGSVDGGSGGSTLFPPDGTPTCTIPLESFQQTIYVLSNKTGTPQTLDSRSVQIDLRPPPQPTVHTDAEGRLGGGEQAVVVDWEGVDSSITTDMLGYQVLCNRAGEFQVFADNSFEIGFQSCPATTSGNGVEGLDPRFICSPLLSATTRSFRIKILQNDIWYGVSVVAIDRSGNASVPDVFYGKATHTKSFYDVYRNDDPDHPGLATGGLCTLADREASRGALTALVGAIAIGAVILARRRRRR
jgi:hypothetical protein